MQPPTIWESIQRAKKQDIIITDDEQSHTTVQVYYLLDIYRDRQGRELDCRPNNLFSNASIAILARNKPINGDMMKKCFDP